MGCTPREDRDVYKSVYLYPYFDCSYKPLVRKIDMVGYTFQTVILEEGIGFRGINEYFSYWETLLNVGIMNHYELRNIIYEKFHFLKHR